MNSPFVAWFVQGFGEESGFAELDKSRLPLLYYIRFRADMAQW